MSARRTTRATTAALKELDKNIADAVASPFNGDTASDKAAQHPVIAANDSIIPASKRSATAEAGNGTKRKKTSSSTAKPVKAAKSNQKAVVKRAFVLPHGMGGVSTPAGNAVESSAGHVIASPADAISSAANGDPEAADEYEIKASPVEDVHMSNTADVPEGVDEQSKTTKRRTRAVTIKTDKSDPDFNKKEKKTIDKTHPDYKKPTSHKDNPYAMTRGYTPYINRSFPTPEQCEEVHRILTEIHGPVTSPAKASAPSVDVAGCGEVPSVLDALLRTVISGNTQMENANKAIKSLSNAYGILEDGVGKDSIDWNSVRHGSKDKLATAIRTAGCGPWKAGHMKTILEMVHEEQKIRASAHIQGAPVPGAQNEDAGQKAFEVQKVLEDELSLEHMRAMTVDEALKEFVKYPGIGVKTAACVALFCLHFPCFAVDTHVHKFCIWLGWIPELHTELDAFNHGEHTVPDHLKYALHQLFIRHGQDCFKCKKITKPGTAAWEEAEDCPLEHLLDRGRRIKNKAKATEDAPQLADVKENGDNEDGTADFKPKKNAKRARKAKSPESDPDIDEQGGIADKAKTMVTAKTAKAGKGRKQAAKHEVDGDIDEQAGDPHGQDEAVVVGKTGRSVKAGKKGRTSRGRKGSKVMNVDVAGNDAAELGDKAIAPNAAVHNTNVLEHDSKLEENQEAKVDLRPVRWGLRSRVGI